MPTVNYKHDDEANGDEWVVNIDYTIDPGDPGCWTLPNGDPGYPCQPATVETTNYRVIEYNRYDANGEMIESTPGNEELNQRFESMVNADVDLYDRITETIWDSEAGDNADDPDWGIDPNEW